MYLKMYNKYKSTNNNVEHKLEEYKLLIDDRYEVQRISNGFVFYLVGRGSYGVVVAGKIKENSNWHDKNVAIKKIENIFEHSTFTVRCLREMKLNRLLQHDNVFDKLFR
jgi:serine/threonine protein kinase